ncbi:PLP-dependent transferase [Colletotrichum somersetense]|nr:PLP-dependent transferase [Colletotrichum somersetense]
MASSPWSEKHINLQLGWPSPSLFPSKALAKAAQSILLDPEVAAQSLVYGPDPGHQDLRTSLAAWLTRFYKPGAGEISPHRLFMVEPTYFLACPSFQDAGFAGRLRGVPEDDEGIDIGFLRRSLVEAEKNVLGNQADVLPCSRAKIYRHIFYVVPTFSNPSGKVMSRQRRTQLVQLAREFDACIIADDVYDWLRWSGNEMATDVELAAPPPRLVDIDRTLPGASPWGNAISNGSFSKIVAPGVRVGWVEGSPLVSADLCKVGAVVSGGSQAHLSSMLMGHLLKSGAIETHIQDTLIPAYRRRYHAIIKSIQINLGPLGVTIVPHGMADVGEVDVVGGFFLFLKFAEHTPPLSEIAEHALAHHDLRIAHGDLMAVWGDTDSVARAKRSYGQGARLCWAWHSEEEINEGIQRLAVAIKTLRRV